VLEGNPDLYGPFWIATTVVLILFLGGTISQYFASGDENYVYDFRLLSGMLFRAAPLILRNLIR
jgi:protein YIPF1/2